MSEVTLDGKPTECRVRRARKEHRCSTRRPTGAALLERRGWDHGPLPEGHSGTIAPGEVHVEYLGESPAYSSGPRYCGACSTAAGFFDPARTVPVVEPDADR